MQLDRPVRARGLGALRMQRKTAWPRGRGDGGSEEPCRSWFSSRVCVGMDQWEGQEGSSRAEAQRLCRDLGYSMWLAGKELDSGSEDRVGNIPCQSSACSVKRLPLSTSHLLYPPLPAPFPLTEDFWVPTQFWSWNWGW